MVTETFGGNKIDEYNGFTGRWENVLDVVKEMQREYWEEGILRQGNLIDWDVFKEKMLSRIKYRGRNLSKEMKTQKSVNKFKERNL